MEEQPEFLTPEPSIITSLQPYIITIFCSMGIWTQAFHKG